MGKKAVVVLPLVVALCAMGAATWRQRRVERRVIQLAGEAEGATRQQVPVGDSPQQGPRDAKVTVVEFADFHCGYCVRAASVRRRLLARYAGRLRWVFKSFAGRPDAARAAMAAHAGGGFWAYAEGLFDAPRLGPRTFQRLVGQAGLDGHRFNELVASEEIAERVEEDRALGVQLGVKGTPTYFINGRRIEGYFPFPYLDVIVRQELVFASSATARRSSAPGRH